MKARLGPQTHLLFVLFAWAYISPPQTSIATCEPHIASGALAVEALGTRYSPDPGRVIVSQSRADPGGSTSVRNVDRPHLTWKEEGYFQRNRDLGQVFTAPCDFELDALVLRTGPSDAAVGRGAPGAQVFVQFFAVVGEPRIDDRGTPRGMDARHGFSKNHRCDDVLCGVEYHPYLIVLGGVFPNLPPTRATDGRLAGETTGRMIYLRWRLLGAARPRFESGKRYAFMVGFQHPGEERAFTLANANRAGIDAETVLGDEHDLYPGGWAVRREGDGSCPPNMIPGGKPPDDPALMERLFRQALFPEEPDRFLQSPTTDGYPDVDTYRDLEFYLEAHSPEDGPR